MKIDRSKLKKGNFDVPHECKTLIARIGNCKSKIELLNELKNIRCWVYGKCELLNWVDVLDKLDEVLEAACQPVHLHSADALPGCPWPMACDLQTSQDAGLDRSLLLASLHFTALLIEHSFTRHLYSSMEHLTTLLASSDMTVVLAVVDVLYVFSKRSNFISRLSAEKKQALIHRLVLLAESWGGKENGFGLAACAQDLPLTSYPESATTLHFEYYDEVEEPHSKKQATCHQLRQIHIPRLDKIGKDASSLMVSFIKNSKPPKDKEMQLFTHIRLALSFSDHEKRLQCVQARLQAISTLIYSNAAQDHLGSLLYSGFVEELVDLLELMSDKLTELKATSLRTLTAVVHFEGNRKLNSIIDATGTSSYHGFLPTLMRQCIQNIIDPENPSFPQSLTTALFSFLYHLASYESGGEALVSCGIMESLIKVISWHGDDSQDHITFVTRAVRVVDLVMSLDMQSFQSYGAMNEFINRLQHEVDICRKEQPFVFQPRITNEFMDSFNSSPRLNSSGDSSAMETERSSALGDEAPGSSGLAGECQQDGFPSHDSARQCFPQRVALLKSILNFIKKAISETSFSDTIRHLMDGSLPCSLKHIISNAEYYGPSLFLLATELVTVYVFQEPSMLSSLQSNGLTDVMLQALLVKNVPATKEVLSALPNVFSALCLNTRGLDAFIACNPFENLFKVLLSPDYLPAMKRRRSSDLPGDTATSLGSAVDELMRHQPSLRSEAIGGIVSLLDRLKNLGQDPDVVCHQRPSVYSMLTSPVASSSSTAVPQVGGQSSQSNNNLGNSSDDDDDDDASVHSVPVGTVATASEGSSTDANVLPGVKHSTEGKLDGNMSKGKKVVPLVDYVLNVMKFTEAILSNNTTDDHCREFVSQRGLDPLLNILVLPNLPSDFPSSTSCQAVASVCKSILTLTHDPQVLVNSLQLVSGLLNEVKPINTFLEAPGASVLLREMTDALLSGIPDPALDAKATPLLHSLKAIHSIITVFITICKANQNDIRNLSLNQWGSTLGLEVLKGLSKLYQSLVWESSVMVNLCSDTCILHVPAEKGIEEVFGIEDVHRIMDHLAREDRTLSMSPEEDGPVPMDLSNEANADVLTEMEVEATNAANVSNTPTSTKDPCRHCYARTVLIKSVLLVASKLGRSLTELFVLLVRVSVGSPARPRRNQQSYQAASIMVAPVPVGRAVASHFAQLMNSSLSWFPPPHSPIWKRRLTYLMCSIAFTSSMIFDDKKQPYHLMLQKFISHKCHQSLYECFHWVITRGNVSSGGHPRIKDLEFPEGSVEFVDVWLTLVEKLVNPKNITESPYNMPAVPSQAGYKPFDPVQYLAQMQLMAFQALSLIWEKQFVTVRTAEASLNILCHIINCENVFKKKKKGSQEVPAGSEGGASTSNTISPREVLGNTGEERLAFRLPEESVNTSHLQQLMDMGFSRAQSIEALLNSNGLEQATEYCLFHPQPAELAETNEEDQMVQAIAMSLNENEAQEISTGEPVAMQQPQHRAFAGDEGPGTNLPAGPVPKELVDDFLKSILRKCLDSIDGHPEVVYKVTDVFALLSERNGLTWLDKALDEVFAEIRSMSAYFIEKSQPMTMGDKRSVLDWANGLSESPHAQRLAARLHFISLLFESQKVSCAKLLERTGLLDLLVRLMHCTQHCIGVARGASTPKWVAPMMLLIDLYEKMAMTTKRRAQLINIIGTNHIWKWFDDRGGRWSSYGPGNNKTIDDAYWAGQTSVRFTAGRRRYLVQFNTMIQINEETGNRRPIMLHIPTKDDQAPADGGPPVAVGDESSSLTSRKTESSANELSGKDVLPCVEDGDDAICGLTPDQGVSLIRSCVGFIGAKVDPNTLHACLRLTLRLTRDLKYSSIFVEMNGPKLLLALPTEASFQGFLSLATLILRHTIEDEKALTYAMEKIIRSSTLGTGSSACGVAMNSNGSRELHYVMRVLSPAICRDKDIFMTVANKVLRIQVPVTKKDDSIFNPANPQLVKCNFPDPRHKIPPLGNLAKEVIQVMLRALATSTPTSSNQSAEENAIMSKEEEKKKKLIPKSSIMRLLAELVRSYVGCANYIANQSYRANETDLISEDCSVLSFILDHLMYKDQQDSSDPHLPALSRLLLASIAASNHSPDAQNALAMELKGALQRSLAMPECADKHNRIQTISQLIATVIQACPVHTQKVSLLDSQASSNLNNMVKVLIKRGLVSDLARVPHSLDLSSPHMALTINAALKPLETLSRIVNQPQVPGNGSGSQKSRPQLLTQQDLIRSVLDASNAEVRDGRAQEDGRQGDNTQGSNDAEMGTGIGALNEAYGDEDDEDLEGGNADVDNMATVDALSRNNLEEEHGAEDLTMAENAEGDRFFETVNDIDLDEDDDDSTDVDDDMADDDEDDPARGNEDHDVSDRLTNRTPQSTLDAVLDTLLDRGGGGNPDVIGDIITMSVERPGEAEDTVEIDIEVATTGANRDPQVVIQHISDNEDDDEGNPANNQEDEPDNEQWEGEIDEDGEDDDNDDDEEGDEDDEDDVDDDDDERSVIDGEDDDDFVGETDESQRNNDYDELLSQWEDMLPASGMMLESSGPMRTYLPISAQGSEAATDAGTSLPPAPSGVMVNHPLLVRSQDSIHRDAAGSQGGNNAGSSSIGGSRLHRTSRSRNTFRYNPNTQTLHVQYTRSRHVNPPAILQRLLGSSSDVMHISNSLGSGGSTRLHLLSNDELRVMTRAGGGAGGVAGDDSLLESLFQGDFLNDDDSSSLGLLTDIPAALSRWAEEAKVLDGEIGMFETMSVVKRDILFELEQLRDAQLAELREKRAKEKQTNTASNENQTNVIDKSVESKTENASNAVVDKEELQRSTESAPQTEGQLEYLSLRGPQQQLYAAPSITANEEATSNGSVVDLPTLQSVLTELNDLAVVRDPLLLEAEVLALTRREATASGRSFAHRAEFGELSAAENTQAEGVQRPTLDANTRILVTFAEDMPTSLQATTVASVANLGSDADNSSSLSEPMSGVTISRETPLETTSADPARELVAEDGRTTSSADRTVTTETSSSSMSANDIHASTASSLEHNPSTSCGESSSSANMFGDIQLPEGVDPSFLAALPENIRQEVIAEQLRLQRIQERAQQQQMEAQTLGISEVNPEFLAALPPNIQEEVLAQQRVEQSRLSQNPDTPTDPAIFIQSLPPTLRQQVLADMDDSMLAVLPADLAAEANVLRRELEDRHRMLLQERLFTQGGVLSGILRHPVYSGRNLQGNSYSLRPSNTVALRSSHWNWSHTSREGRGTTGGANQAAVAALKIRGRHLLDNEALTCLLVLLFVDEPRLNTTRLHRVVRNLSYHAPTRAWIVDSLLSVLSRTNEQLHLDEVDVRPKEKWTKKRMLLQESPGEACFSNPGEDNQSVMSDLPAWLNIYLCAALGSQTNVFRVSRSTSRHHSLRSSPGSISIHPQACPIICRHVLDILISLAKTFPTHFLPQQPNQMAISCNQLAPESDSPLAKGKAKDNQSGAASSGCPSGATSSGKPDFWESLIKLDAALSGKKGKSSQKEKTSSAPTTGATSQVESNGNTSLTEGTTFESSPLGQLMSTLSHPVIRRSQMLTDKLLRVLKLISSGLMDNITKPIATSLSSANTTSTSGTTTTATANVSLSTASSNVASLPIEEAKTGDRGQDGTPLFSFCIDLEKSTVLENQLKLLVEILISKHCSEEGFEDATSLLLQLAKSDSFLCETILKLLIKGAHQLGSTVCQHINKLSDELDSVVPVDVSPKEEEDVNSLLSGSSNQKGILQDRFGGGSIVVHAPTSSKFKGRGRELQLPSMQLLTNKGSSQNFLLRVLKIIILLRGPMKSIMKKTGTNQQPSEASASASTSAGEHGESSSTPMEVENSGNLPTSSSSNSWPNMPHMTEFIHLDELWDTLGGCLLKLAMMPDNHAVLVLQPAVEAFFFVHAGKRDQTKKEVNQTLREDQLAHVSQYNPAMSPNPHQSDRPKLDRSSAQNKSQSLVRPETQKFISFAETHRTVLNQILRQSTVPLADGPFSVLVDYTRVLDFDVKRRYFRQELDRTDEGLRKEDLAVHVRRDNVFEDSFRELHRRTPDEWKNRFYIVFEGEEGQDAGGLLREWYIIISREIFNPNYALFCTSPGDRVTYTINTSSHCNSNHLSYFKFVGRIIAKAIYDNKLLECYFTRSFYKHILGVPVKYTDMESEDYDFYKGLVFLLENNVEELGYDLTFSTEIQEFGVTTIRDLKEDGRNVRVTEENKKEYVKLVCQMKMTGAIKQQLTAFLDGFYSIIPKRLISIFNEQELELLISGLPSIDIDDLKSNTEIHKYQANALQIQWFWRALRSFDQADRARFLQFVTGTSKVPLQGFAYLEGMNGIQKFQIHKDDRSTDRLPSAHTCFNQLDLPIYETYDKLKRMLLLAIHECSEGFGLA